MDISLFDGLPVVHNAWSIYRATGQDSLAELNRPQDWGHPRWLYRVYRFSSPSHSYTVIAHCWIEKIEGDPDLKEHEIVQMVCGLITSIFLPGTPPELCGRDYLDEEDFWSKSWGEQPPIYDQGDNEDDGY